MSVPTGGWGAWGLTIIVSENEYEDGLETKEVKKIPGERRDPSHVEVAGSDAGLKHGFEAEGEGEGKFHYKQTSASQHMEPCELQTHNCFRVE